LNIFALVGLDVIASLLQHLILSVAVSSIMSDTKMNELYQLFFIQEGIAINKNGGY